MEGQLTVAWKSTDEDPFAEEIYSVERLEQFAATLAAEHEVSEGPDRGRRLLPRFEDNGRQLRAAYRILAEVASQGKPVSPAAEWLVDNFFVVDEQLRQIREDLPKRYYYELPKLITGQMQGYPRIYSLALAFIAHNDSRIDRDALQRFVRAYQTITPLTIGETWAIAISLRVALVENLRRLAVRVIAAREQREEADRIADELLDAPDEEQRTVVVGLIKQLGKRKRISGPFVVQLTQRLRDQDPDVAPLVEWFERRLQRDGQSIEHVVGIEHHRQAASQVTVGNIITSMKLLSTIDWQVFVESVCLSEPIFASDPAHIYARMDFATRDRYRHVIERIAKRTRSHELDVARRAVQLAQSAADRDRADRRRAHIGYYLIDSGLPDFEREFGYRPTLAERTERAVLNHPAIFYFGTLSLLTALILALIVTLVARAGASNVELLVAALLALIPVTDISVSFLNWDITHTLRPRVLPKLDAEAEVPVEARTMIVIPTMLTSEAVVSELIERLEVHYLANRDPQFYFALLSDFADAPFAEMPDDQALMEIALAGIERLNQRYDTSDGDEKRFFVFHRKRQWNESEEKWIAWERKRGKLEEFNLLLRGARETSFVVVGADQALLRSIRYVLTLDSDTQLPRDTARKLVATICHPLNQAELDPVERRVVRGYGILQPRIGVGLESSVRSRLARVFAGNAGIDPYSLAASDVYQDLFDEGSFTGKGLYDVDAFQEALQSRVPDNSLLSHDLFEGLYARSALVTDIVLLDDHPAKYDAWAKRLHRWTRGDWQIARWLLPRVPNAERVQVRNVLPLISKWKIFDNLRRSLVAPTLILWLVAIWTILPGRPVILTIFALLVVAFPVYAPATTRLFSRPRAVPWIRHWSHLWSDFTLNARRVALTLVFLPHEAWLELDAIARVAYRKLISGKHLLEWTTAAQVEKQDDRLSSMREVYPAAGFAVALGIVIGWRKPEALVLALPFLLAWIASPLISHYVSLPTRFLKRLAAELTTDERRKLRLIARRTWRFFETFVGDEDRWLPPDNVQENPQPLNAHRTSPTNIGLCLLSTVSARDFGYVGLIEMVERLGLTIGTVEQMEKFHGHLLNWYDTRTLEPLMPQYVSTVDSGNLAAHLLAIKQAMVELPDEKVLGPRLLDGLHDTLVHLHAEAKVIGTIKERSQVVTAKQLMKELESCERMIEGMRSAPEDSAQWGRFLADLVTRVTEAEDIARALEREQGSDALETFAEFHSWMALMLNQVRALRCDFDMLIPLEARWLINPGSMLDEQSGAGITSWRPLAESFIAVPVVGEVEVRCREILEEVSALSNELTTRGTRESDPALRELQSFGALIERAAAAANGLLRRAGAIAHRCDQLIAAMDFQFLLNKERKLFVIGYNVSEGRCDDSFYDLLASEARLGSFVAIAKGDATQEHWFRLGRQITQVDGVGRSLISWTGTMFEYLMPLLVTHDYPQTLLHETYRSIVARQIAYGRERGVPWGVSESAYHARDLQLNYQYGPFGVPGLGLKRGLSEDLVIAPYATFLAAMIAPRAAAQNLQRLEQMGALSRYGFYEAIDFTPERLPQNSKQIVIASFMTHHQGMSLVALDNVLNDNVMRRRFHSEPIVQATELLLQERVPTEVVFARFRAEEVAQGRLGDTLAAPVAVTYDTANQLTPRTQLISNGRYSVMVTSAGAGFSTCTLQSGQVVAVTRWREDIARDHWGSFCYLRDVRSGAVWSCGYQPTARKPHSYEVTFTEERAVFRRVDAGILTQTDIIVSPEDNAEVRRISVTNKSPRVREIELTSYAEVVLTPPAADAAHPAFSNLFLEIEYIAGESSLVARRRQRTPEDPNLFAVHTITTEGETVGSVQHETSRQRFLGRGHDARYPLAVMEDRPLANTTGTVLDPIFSLRQRVRLQPNETARITFSMAVAESREHILMLADKYHDTNIFERVERLAWTHAQVQMRHLNIDAREAHLFQRLAGKILYCENSLRPISTVLALNRKSQSDLWKYGIGGDVPIVLVRIKAADDIELLRQMLRAHEYLRLKGLTFDLVILNDHAPSYLQSLQDDIQMLVRATGAQFLLDRPGGIHLRRTDIMTDEDKILLHTVARVVLVTERGTLPEQLQRRPLEERETPPAFVAKLPERVFPDEPLKEISDLQFSNGVGGFGQDGREYVIVLNEGQWTPAPWTNVIANSKDFGFLMTETGSGYTWSVNSRENRLTPWSNDAVSDPPGEALYLRDEDTGTIWSPTPLPIRESQPYVVRHGQGYTSFQHTSHGIAQELTMFVPADSTVKISTLRLRNLTDRRRRISVTAYIELVMGVIREKSGPFVVTEMDDDTGALFARNSYNNEFKDRLAFAAMSPRPSSVSCDRKSFLGRNGTPVQPAALGRTRLDNRAGAGLDPCLALQTVVDIAPGESREVIVLLGDSGDRPEAHQMIDRFLNSSTVDEALEDAVNAWDEMLSTISVRTPDVAMNFMLNRWLLYQALACRVWARTAFYQSGGAYGFRDQLQDVAALVYSRPDIARAQLLLAAQHQFREGDVQHWWHPPTGRGVRTRISDDLLWLPYVASLYCRVAGDRAVLDEVVPFVDAPLLADGESESYQSVQVTSEQVSLYEHCIRALDRSLTVGEHGIPLMGAGDWNDGMNRVGHGGKGESVWLGWFLCATLEGFSTLSVERGDEQRAARYRAHISSLQTALEANAWDGDWYLRAYFDDGTPLGSAQNDECRIDSIAQSWGVISRAADKRRAVHAMAAVETHLIRRGDGLVLLFSPPFNRSVRDPGYIRGYVPGVRENGGQYTHAALWTLIAFAELGYGDRAGELFELLNPIHHSSTRAGLHKYRVEPYVAAGDIYAVAPHTGRGGWTWYTGSAAWMYRAGLESILGFRLAADRLIIDPCIPRSWREFEITYRMPRVRRVEKTESERESTVYGIKVENPHGVCRGVARLEIDGESQLSPEIMLVDDGRSHNVRIVLGEEEMAPLHGRASVRDVAK